MSPRSRRNIVFDGAFIGHTLEMRRSPAWRALPDTARRVLDRLEVEHMEHAGPQMASLSAPMTSSHALASAARQSRSQYDS
jgi:hypothetical protein